jgi:hypothetical protein
VRTPAQFDCADPAHRFTVLLLLPPLVVVQVLHSLYPDTLPAAAAEPAAAAGGSRPLGDATNRQGAPEAANAAVLDGKPRATSAMVPCDARGTPQLPAAAACTQEQLGLLVTAATAAATKAVTVALLQRKHRRRGGSSRRAEPPSSAQGADAQAAAPSSRTPAPAQLQQLGARVSTLQSVVQHSAPAPGAPVIRVLDDQRLAALTGAAATAAAAAADADGTVRFPRTAAGTADAQPPAAAADASQGEHTAKAEAQQQECAATQTEQQEQAALSDAPAAESADASASTAMVLQPQQLPAGLQDSVQRTLKGLSDPSPPLVLSSVGTPWQQQQAAAEEQRYAVDMHGMLTVAVLVDSSAGMTAPHGAASLCCRAVVQLLGSTFDYQQALQQLEVTAQAVHAVMSAAADTAGAAAATPGSGVGYTPAPTQAAAGAGHGVDDSSAAGHDAAWLTGASSRSPLLSFYQQQDDWRDMQSFSKVRGQGCVRACVASQRTRWTHRGSRH